MKITSCSLNRLEIPLVKPFTTALRTVDTLVSIVIIVETDTGLIGYGEAPPTPPITGETLESIQSALSGYIIPALIGRDPRQLYLNRLLVQRAVIGNTSAKAAMDIALYDLAAQSFGVPVYTLLGGAKRPLVSDITISTDTPEAMAEDAASAARAGYRVLKVKVGKDPSGDIERVLAVKEAAGDHVSLRLDANQGWRPKETVEIISNLLDSGVRLDLVEQPVPADDIEGLSYVTRELPVDVAADESLFSAADAMRLLSLRAADVLNIKLMKCGGIGEALRICSAAEAYQIPCMVGSMLESRISVQAAAHLASAVTGITRIDLDPPRLLAEDPVVGGALFSGPDIILGDEPGFGIREIRGLVLL